MKGAPKDALYRMDVVKRAWTNLRSQKAFGGMTLDQYLAVTKPSYDVREEIAATEAKLQSLIALRASLDDVSLDAASRVVHGVKSDPDEGEDGELYAAMGFVRKSHRRSTARRAVRTAPKAPNGDLTPLPAESKTASDEAKASNGAA
jgi:hypothetical protein